MLRTFQFRLQPNTTQTAALEFILRDSCETYNAALQERKEAWKLDRKSITYLGQQGQITQLRQDPQCGLVLGRDHNAGLNILALGMSVAGLVPSECVQGQPCI